MLQHVVAITWNDQVPPNYAETVSAVLQEMASRISSVREYHCGPDLGVSTAVNADYLTEVCRASCYPSRNTERRSVWYRSIQLRNSSGCMNPWLHGVDGYSILSNFTRNSFQESCYPCTCSV
jgi:hypothetical protein